VAQQTNTSRQAKKTWIDATHGESQHVTDMKLETFNRIMTTNEDVNTHVDSFTSKLAQVQKEIMTIKAKDYSF
jgi:hypothetical protein